MNFRIVSSEFAKQKRLQNVMGITNSLHLDICIQVFYHLKIQLHFMPITHITLILLSVSALLRDATQPQTAVH